MSRHLVASTTPNIVFKRSILSLLFHQPVIQVDCGIFWPGRFDRVVQVPVGEGIHSVACRDGFGDYSCELEVKDSVVLRIGFGFFRGRDYRENLVAYHRPKNQLLGRIPDSLLVAILSLVLFSGLGAVVLLKTFM